MELKEEKLFEPVYKFFKDLGYKVYTEISYHSSPTDVVSVKDEELVGIELKTGFNRKVFQQAYYNQLVYDYSYVCSNVKPRAKFSELCVKHGVGILEIIDGQCFEILKAERNEKLHKPWRDRVFEVIGYNEEGGRAGIPTLAGTGIGQDCLRRIKEYLKENKNANWKEIYQNVGNHYSSPQSLAGSMGSWQKFNLREYKKTTPPCQP